MPNARNPLAPADFHTSRLTMPARSHSSLRGTISRSRKARYAWRNISWSSSKIVRSIGTASHRCDRGRQIFGRNPLGADFAADRSTVGQMRLFGERETLDILVIDD